MACSRRSRAWGPRSAPRCSVSPLAGARLPRSASRPGAEPLLQRPRGVAVELHAPLGRGPLSTPAMRRFPLHQALLEQTADSLENLQASPAAARRAHAAQCQHISLTERRPCRRSNEDRAEPLASPRREPSGAEAGTDQAGRRRHGTRSGRCGMRGTCATSRCISRAPCGGPFAKTGADDPEVRSEIRLLARTIAALADRGRSGV